MHPPIPPGSVFDADPLGACDTPLQTKKVKKRKRKKDELDIYVYTGLLISNIAIAGDTIADTFGLSLDISPILSKISI